MESSDAGEARARFDTLEYHADDSLRPARYALRGSPEKGWRIERDGAEHLVLGKGYRLLRSQCCGICSTDLARRFLPFALPQIIGHELVATDEGGQRFVVEINASHRARGLAGADCEFCKAGLSKHCPERRVLGIHDLPGGFGPWILAPQRAVLPLPDSISSDLATFVEPLAAALHATESLSVRPGDRIAVLGTRKLGLLVIAALAARRRRGRLPYRILGLSRRRELRARALALGADEALHPDEVAGSEIVIDTTGSSEGLEAALEIAERELHLKSTHGQPAAGLERITELVVDEICLEPWREDRSAIRDLLGRGGDSASDGSGIARPLVAWISDAPAPDWLERDAEILAAADPLEIFRRLEKIAGRLPRTDLAVVENARSVDRVLRPLAGDERSVIKPRGTILIRNPANEDGPALNAIAGRGLRLSSSRCGDFSRALELLQGDPELASRLPELITHRLPAGQLEEGLKRARSSECIKAVMVHSEAPVEAKA
jgi:D-arabinose 1-dehydrogenase-like Zn-dependent alcohol dehydrogenase